MPSTAAKSADVLHDGWRRSLPGGGDEGWPIESNHARESLPRCGLKEGCRSPKAETNGEQRLRRVLLKRAQEREPSRNVLRNGCCLDRTDVGPEVKCLVTWLWRRLGSSTIEIDRQRLDPRCREAVR
jgi:hypothetical protein